MLQTIYDDVKGLQSHRVWNIARFYWDYNRPLPHKYTFNKKYIITANLKYLQSWRHHNTVLKIIHFKAPESVLIWRRISY